MKSLMFFLLVFSGIKCLSQSSDSIKTSCKRDFVVSPNKIEVTIIITKANYSGFARIYEKIPAGSAISKARFGNAIYSVENDMLRIVWENIPAKNLVEISYELKLNNSVRDTFGLINGTFSSEFFGPETGPVVISQGTKKYAEKSTVELTKNNPTQSSAQPIAGSNGVYFCIQIAAMSKNVTTDFLKKNYGFDGEFESHFEENVYRITVGKFKSLSEAEAVLKEYKEKYFKKCFLSAYQDGHKITLSEAQRLLE